VVLHWGLAQQRWLSFIKDPIKYSVRLHVDPSPGPPLVLHYGPLEYENNNTSKHAALLDCSSDASSEEEVGLPRPSPRVMSASLQKATSPGSAVAI
jgi:hypothetical protein